MENLSVENYDTRLKRVKDAIGLKLPDRVPIVLDFGLLTSKFAGVPIRDIYYSHEKLAGAYKKSIPYFQPDIFYCIHFISGAAWEAVGNKTNRWPGHGGPDEHTNQFVEGEYMKADEYDAFLTDPADFVVRNYLPRVCEAAEPFKSLPHMVLLSALGGGGAGAFTRPDIVQAFKAFYKAGLISREWEEAKLNCVRDMQAMGYPAMYHRALFQPPFDYFGDNFRGMKGIMLDMYRQPDKLMEAMERIAPIIIKRILSIPFHEGIGTNHIFFGGPHKGAEGYMSLKDFEKFYWPGMRAIILAMIDAGITPWLFWEGDYTASRLEYLLDFPEGKVVHHFDRGNIFRAKEVLGGHHCIAGGIMPILLTGGSVQDVKDYCKKLIDVCGKDGGYILSASCAMDEAKPENVKAMIDFTKEYGVYR
jgi:hypothetical protein